MKSLNEQIKLTCVQKHIFFIASWFEFLTSASFSTQLARKSSIFSSTIIQLNNLQTILILIVSVFDWMAPGIRADLHRFPGRIELAP